MIDIIFRFQREDRGADRWTIGPRLSVGNEVPRDSKPGCEDESDAAERAWSRYKPRHAASPGYGSRMKPALFAHRSPLLDALRALAVTMVVFFHVATRYPADQLDIAAQQVLRYGFLGVDIFYPLSGFLITRYLLAHGEPGAIRAFFLRRVFRIVPLYVIAVTIFFIASGVTGFEADVLDRIWATYLFLTGWFAFFGGPDSVPFTVTWSLSVEEFAYLLFGLSALALRRAFPAILVFLAIAPFVLRIWLYAQAYEHIYYLPLARLDSIATGGLTALWIGRGPKLIWVLASATALSALVGQLGGPVAEAALFTTVTLATCTAIAACETIFKGLRGRLLEMAARIGLYSYFIYLFHFFFLYALLMTLERLSLPMPGFWIMGTLCMVTTYGAAWLSFTWFEAPLMAFGRQFEDITSERKLSMEARQT